VRRCALWPRPAGAAGDASAQRTYREPGARRSIVAGVSSVCRQPGLSVNIFFDVDHTLIDSGNRLRPGVRELFAQLTAEGHQIYLWSGIGERPEVLDQHGLGAYVTACYVKPLYQHRRMLGPLGIGVNPDFAIDDHPDLPAVFGGITVQRFLVYDAGDREMERVYAAIRERTP